MSPDIIGLTTEAAVRGESEVGLAEMLWTRWMYADDESSLLYS